jgi:hypothetical protein
MGRVGVGSTQQLTANSQQLKANSQQPKAKSQPPTANSQKLKANSQKLFSLPHLSYGGIHSLSQVQYNKEEIIVSLANWVTTNNIPSGFYKLDITGVDLKTATIPTIQLRSLTKQLSHFEQNKSTFWMDVQESEESQLSHFSSNLRRKIRASARKGVSVTIGGSELTKQFIKVYQQNLHRLGSPALDKSFMDNMLVYCNNHEARIAIAWYKDKPIGGGLWLSYNGFYENQFFATLPSFNNLYTTYALHWKMIQQAIHDNGGIYSFGRSTTNSTVAHFKTQWPVSVKPIYYCSTTSPKTNIRNLHFLTHIWKHLPAFLVNTLGPPIAKRIF